MGQTAHGRYVEIFEKMNPDDLDKYYGCHGAPRRRRAGQTGAGHSDNEDGGDDNEAIAAGQEQHIRHDAVEVPDSKCPFQLDPTLSIFHPALKDLARKDYTPRSLGVTPGEWEAGRYPEIETIKYGLRGKIKNVSLPSKVWLPRAIRWAQGLELMTRLCLLEEQS